MASWSDDRKLSERAWARTTDPETSWAAARSVEPELRKSQAAVLSILRAMGPMHDEDIAGWYVSVGSGNGFPHQSPSGLRTRRKELVDAGLVVDTGRRGTLRSGRLSIIWAAAEVSSPRTDGGTGDGEGTGSSAQGPLDEDGPVQPSLFFAGVKPDWA